MAAGVTSCALIAVPVLMTWLLTSESNRPAIEYAEAARGSLHPMHFLTLLFADLYGANNPAIPYWGPASFPWGETGLVLAQNMGQLYAGVLPLLALAAVALTSKAFLAREIRPFALAALLTMLYALGWYTPAFRVFYETLPAVSLFRRPADAAFLLGALFAILGGYAVHRLLILDAVALRRVATAGRHRSIGGRFRRTGGRANDRHPALSALADRDRNCVGGRRAGDDMVHPPFHPLAPVGRRAAGRLHGGGPRVQQRTQRVHRAPARRLRRPAPRHEERNRRAVEIATRVRRRAGSP